MISREEVKWQVGWLQNWELKWKQHDTNQTIASKTKKRPNKNQENISDHIGDIVWSRLWTFIEFLGIIMRWIEGKANSRQKNTIADANGIRLPPYSQTHEWKVCRSHCRILQYSWAGKDFGFNCFMGEWHGMIKAILTHTHSAHTYCSPSSMVLCVTVYYRDWEGPWGTHMGRR